MARALKRYADVIAGRAVVVKPAKPASYKGQFRVVRGMVIVPRRKGERIRVNANGEIKVSRKIGRRVLRGGYEKIEQGIGPPGIYFLPLQRQEGVEWHRFGSAEELHNFVFVTSPKIGETFKNWGRYVLRLSERTVDRLEDSGELDETLEEKLFQRLARRRRAKRLARRRRARRAKRR